MVNGIENGHAVFGLDAIVLYFFKKATTIILSMMCNKAFCLMYVFVQCIIH